MTQINQEAQFVQVGDKDIRMVGNPETRHHVVGARKATSDLMGAVQIINDLVTALEIEEHKCAEQRFINGQLQHTINELTHGDHLEKIELEVNLLLDYLKNNQEEPQTAMVNGIRTGAIFQKLMDVAKQYSHQAKEHASSIPPMATGNGTGKALPEIEPSVELSKRSWGNNPHAVTLNDVFPSLKAVREELLAYPESEQFNAPVELPTKEATPPSPEAFE